MSPEAAAVTRYADIPVSYYNGVPDITVPLYTVDVDGFLLPITLVYHSSGIRVDQEASWVGLGWVLNCGGRISRSAKCVDDFLEGGRDQNHPYCNMGYYDAPELAAPYNDMYNGYLETSTDGMPVLLNHLTKDSEPDIFYYNLPGYTGKFIFDKHRGAVLFDKSHNLKIDILGNGIIKNVKFRITTPDGVQYLFEEKEYTKNYFMDSHLNRNQHGAGTCYDDDADDYYQWVPIRYPNSGIEMEPMPCDPYRMATCWCLTRITTRTGRNINFAYEQEKIYLPAQESCEVYNSTHSSRQFFYKSKAVCDVQRLTSITWDSGSVTFTCTGRDDLHGTAKKLSSVTVRNVSSQTIRNYQFNYSYFNDTYEGAYQHVFKRLKLVSLTEGNSGETYLFSYYDGIMPPKNSKDTDYWNISNGRVYGENYFIGVYLGNDSEYKGVTKQADYTSAVIGQLREIRYPTGGYTRFTYELNRFYPYFWDRTNNDLATDGTSLNGSYASYGLFVYNNYTQNNHPGTPSDSTLTFQITGTTDIKLKCMLENESASGFRDPDYVYCDHELSPLGILECISPANGVIYAYECPYIFFYQSGNLYYGEGTELELEEQIFRLSPGTYRFRACCPPKEVSAAWTIELDRVSGPPEQDRPDYEEGGGLRIAEIETETSRRSFSYPVGNLMTWPTLFYYGNRTGDSSNGAQCVVQVSESKTPMSTFNNGYAVGYSWVEETVTSDGEDKTVRHSFLNAPEIDLFDDSQQFAYSPVMVNYTNGLPTSTEYYDDGQLLRRVEYTYESTYGNTVKAFIDRGGHHYSSDMLEYYYRVEWPRMKTETTTTFTDASTPSVAELLTYSYNAHDLPSQETQTVDGLTYAKHYKYPFDFSTPSCLAMTGRNIIKTPVETIQFVDGVVYEANRLVCGDSAQFFLPEAYQTMHPGDGYQNKYNSDVTYDRYDSQGHILQMTEKGVCTSYIWGYGYHYPIAEIRGATYEQVIAVLGGSSTVDAFLTRTSPADSEVWTFLQPLISSPSSSGMLTTVYTYKPLFGVTSMTKPNGTRTYYQYDAAGRLTCIKDTNGNILKTYTYHYAQ